MYNLNLNDAEMILNNKWIVVENDKNKYSRMLKYSKDEYLHDVYDFYPIYKFKLIELNT